MNGTDRLGQRLRLDCLQNALRVDDALEVRVDHLGTRQNKALLLVRCASQSAKDGVELAEGTVGPDNQTSNVTARSQLKQVQLSDFLNGDTGNVAESTNQTSVVVVDNNWTTLLLVTTIAALAFASTLTL